MISRSSIGFKNLNTVDGMFSVAWHQKLIALFKWLKVRCNNVVITGGYEHRGTNSVHETIPLRGLDLRSTIYNNPQSICDDINSCWIYDPDRPEKAVAMYHNTGRGWHIHLQVHPNTIYEIDRNKCIGVENDDGDERAS